MGHPERSLGNFGVGRKPMHPKYLSYPIGIVENSMGILRKIA
jgi:hypothetical protein